MTYPHPSGNGAPYPPGPPLRQPPVQPPPASGPPALLALQGQLQNPVPLLLSAAGLMLVCFSFFLPQASYEYDGSSDPLQGYFLAPDLGSDLYLALSDNPAVVPLVLAVAITLALAGSRRWLLFGRLACFGLALVGVAAAVGGAFAWQQRLRDLLDGADEYRDALSGEGSEETGNAAEKVDIDFGAGMWVLILGIIALAVAVMLVKTAPRGHRPYPPPANGMLPPAGYPAQPPAPAAPPAYPAATATPPPAAPPAETAGDRDVSVHDDPPSLSIYKPPPKET